MAFTQGAGYFSKKTFYSKTTENPVNSTSLWEKEQSKQN